MCAPPALRSLDMLAFSWGLAMLLQAMLLEAMLLQAMLLQAMLLEAMLRQALLLQALLLQAMLLQALLLQALHPQDTPLLSIGLIVGPSKISASMSMP
jgi:hypothetical protein